MDLVRTHHDRAVTLLERFRALRVRCGWIRPFSVELFGTPCSGKTSLSDGLRDFFDAAGYGVTTPREGAREIEWKPRKVPEYNFRTAEYALGRARDLAFAPNAFEVAIFDRAVSDAMMNMLLFREDGLLTEAQYRGLVGYYGLGCNTYELFDLHVCLVADPAAGLHRRFGGKLPKKYGSRVNPTAMARLRDLHDRAWQDYGWSVTKYHAWVDSTSLDKDEVRVKALDSILEQFERRLAELERQSPPQA